MSKRLPTLVEAALSTEQVSGLTHNFYRYPARFSPVFAREAIETFTTPGQVVLDLFVGGGTTVVEASYLGRKSIGVDISSLATFVSSVKTTPLSETSATIVQRFAEEIRKLRLSADSRPRKTYNYPTNLSSRETWPLRDMIAIFLLRIEGVQDIAASSFLRCGLLRTAQWALDSRERIPSVKDFRERYREDISQMLDELAEYAEQVSINRAKGLLWRDGSVVKLFNMDAGTADKIQLLKRRPPSLVLMSPPYPGVHVLYHRWQVRGRRETPAAFWIANSIDGKGASAYTIADRKSKNLDKYFEGMQRVFRSLSRVATAGTTVVQQVAFSQPKRQLPRYLDGMEQAGFREIFVGGAATNRRIWRTVPNRKWYADQQGLTGSSREVVLVHRKR